jgi:ribosomal protein L40E
MDATALLADLRARGVELERRGDKLHWRAPEGVLTPDLLAVLAERKAEIMALLVGPTCCRYCAERAAWPDPLADGCGLHGVTADQVASWWAEAEKRGATVSYCACCGGPSPNGALACRKCGGAPARSAR